MSNCMCWKTYQCLSCEAKANRPVTEGTQPKVAQRKIAQCGTRAGYSRHLNMGEPTCPDCRAAQSEAVKRYNREKALING